jgi:hypothetical protein
MAMVSLFIAFTFAVYRSDPWDAAPAFSRGSGRFISRWYRPSGAGIEAVFRAPDFDMARVILRAAKPAPKANRITGPKLLAAVIPAK